LEAIPDEVFEQVFSVSDFDAAPRKSEGFQLPMKIVTFSLMFL
jgi:hypothetical protein